MEKVSVFIPMYSVRTRGINSTNIKQGAVQVRISDLDRELIIAQSQKLGITVSSFIRQCAVNVAKELEQINAK